MSADSVADDLQKESETSSPVKTLLRLWLTIRNPLKAMRHVAYDPDLLIVLVMFMLFAIYSLPAAFVEVSRIELPDQVMLYNSPEEAIAYGKTFTMVSDFRTDAAKLYWGEILMYYVIMILSAALVLIVGSRLLMGSFRFKEILSGVTYSSVILLIIGILQMGLVLVALGVEVPYHTEGNLSYISWPEDQIALFNTKTLNAAVNLTTPGMGTSELWDINVSTTLAQAGEAVTVDTMQIRGRSLGGSVVVTFSNGTSTVVGPGTLISISTSMISFQVQDSRTYVKAINGSLIELQQDANMGFELQIGTDREKSVISNVTWPGTNGLQTWVAHKPQMVTILRNVSAPQGLVSNTVYGYCNITIEIKDDGAVMIQANMTLPYEAQTDSTVVKWVAESVLAQQLSLVTYFSRGMSAQMEQPAIKGAFLAMWAISRAWQSVVLICLLKSSYEDTSWLRVVVLVAVQQFLLFQLGF